MRNRGKWKIEVIPTDAYGNVVTDEKRGFHKTTIRVVGLSLIVLSLAPLSPADVLAATEAAKEASAGGESWNGLINAILGILDPVAKVFGLIAGLAIMTGNGKIGLERLFWLSIGYITARKVEVWIAFLNSI
ncbi:hypothetical protein M3_0076 [Lysinibacillus phage vB_LfM_LysYB1]|nr:hypothetical protein M3_0076 [Lysinibacillus phage vB_LfM_LysYB1]WAB25181.1 hypothetical protein M5_0003 [Lysinibacillus phage vB_LfM_LysYB2]